MDGRFYKGRGLHIEQIASQFVRACLAQGYQVQQMGDRKQMVIQMREGGELESLIGLQAALTLTLQQGPAGVSVTMGQQQWLDKAAIGVLGALVLWPLTLTAGAGVIRQVHLEGQALSMLDAVFMQQGADAHTSQSPWQEGGYAQQASPSSPPPQTEPRFYGSSPQRSCLNCQAPNDVDDRFCSACGTSLQVQKKRCTECSAELKPDAAFCPKCGSKCR